MEQELAEGQRNRLFNEQQAENLKQEVLQIALEERPEIVKAHFEEIKTFIKGGLEMIQTFEKATYQEHPVIDAETDVVYIDSGPGPISYKLLEPGKIDLDDVNYHQFPWSRKMDRQRSLAAYKLAWQVTGERIKEQRGKTKLLRKLTPEDFEKFGPYLMYTSTQWQNSHVWYVHNQLKEAGYFKIPDRKLIMYDEFTNRQGERKPITHTEDQIEGLQFPSRPDGNPPRRIAIVSHPAHLMRVMHILGKYPDSIPEGTILQAFPVPTPLAAVTEYAKNELLGTIGTVFSKDRASLTPYNKYQL